MLLIESFRRPTVEAKVDVLAMEVVSLSFIVVDGMAGLTLGEAGWKRVGGLSFGKSWFH